MSRPRARLKKPLPTLELPPFTEIVFPQRGYFMVAQHAMTVREGAEGARPGADVPQYVIHGQQSPHLFKTVRNAMRKAAERSHKVYKERGYAPSLLMVFDPTLLPVVLHDEDLMMHRGLPDRITELEFAERQTDLWAARAKHLRDQAAA